MTAVGSEASGLTESEPAQPLSTLERDSACCRDLNWRCYAVSEINPEVLASSLVELGWIIRCAHANLKVFRHSRGHEVAWVTSTGRFQLRVDLEVESASRHQMAVEIYSMVLQAARAARVGEARRP